MVYSPLSMARRHVLCDLYSRCEALEGAVPVFIAAAEEAEGPNLIGHVDQCLGIYADAFTFHVPDDICKLLSGGSYSYSLEYEFTNPSDRTSRGRIRLSSISLIEIGRAHV